MRGEHLAERYTSADVHVVNVPSIEFTFNGPADVSDIDLTLLNEAALGLFDISWKIMSGYHE